MSEKISEEAILARQARFRLFDLANERWPESEGDIGRLSENLAKMLLESGIYLDTNSRLLHYSDEDHAESKENKNTRGGTVVPKKWAVIDMGNEEGLVVGGISRPILFKSKDEAKSHARGMEAYQNWHESCFDELVITWTATHFSFKATMVENFPISEGADEGMMAANMKRLDSVKDRIEPIIDLGKIGEPEEIIPRGMYASVEEIGEKVDNARRSQISRRWAIRMA